LILEAFETGRVTSNTHTTIFPELQRIVIESVLAQRETILCDMPELLLRMKIGANYSLKEL
jgi:hypothetical protein